MNLVIKLAYGVAIAVLMVLTVVFAIRAAYEPPDQPRYGDPPRAYTTNTPQYEEDRRDYHRNVFLIAGLIGLGSMAAGVALAKRLDALRLGLILGGVATFIYSFAQAGEDIDDIGTTAILPVAAVGLVALLLLGYRRLAERDE